MKKDLILEVDWTEEEENAYFDSLTKSPEIKKVLKKWYWIPIQDRPKDVNEYLEKFFNKKSRLNRDMYDFSSWWMNLQFKTIFEELPVEVLNEIREFFENDLAAILTNIKDEKEPESKRYKLGKTIKHLQLFLKPYGNDFIENEINQYRDIIQDVISQLQEAEKVIDSPKKQPGRPSADPEISFSSECRNGNFEKLHSYFSENGYADKNRLKFIRGTFSKKDLIEKILDLEHNNWFIRNDYSDLELKLMIRNTYGANISREYINIIRSGFSTKKDNK